MSTNPEYRGQQRDNIRGDAKSVAVEAWANVPNEQHAECYKIDQLEQLILAVCNLAETIDANAE